MLQGLKRLAGGGMLLLELRGTRKELARLAEAQEQTNHLLARLVQVWAPLQQAVSLGEAPSVEVTYVNEVQQRTLMEIELGLTGATGQPPTEEEVLAEYDRRVSAPAAPPAEYQG